MLGPVRRRIECPSSPPSTTSLGIKSPLKALQSDGWRRPRARTAGAVRRDGLAEPAPSTSPSPSPSATKVGRQRGSGMSSEAIARPTRASN